MDIDAFIAIAKPIINGGGTYKDVGEATGMSKDRAAYWCRRLKLLSKNKRGRPVGTASPRQFNHAEAARMRANGLTLANIAEHFDVSRQAIHQAIKRLPDTAPREKGSR